MLHCEVAYGYSSWSEESLVLYWEALCVAWSGGALTLQQQSVSVPESCSLNSCLGNKDTLLCGCDIFKPMARMNRGIQGQRGRLSDTSTYVNLQTWRVLIMHGCISFCCCLHIRHIKASKGSSNRVLSCSVCLCSTCSHTWASPVCIFCLPPGQRRTIKNLVDISHTGSLLHLLSILAPVPHRVQVPCGFLLCLFSWSWCCSMEASYHFLYPELYIITLLLHFFFNMLSFVTIFPFKEKAYVIKSLFLYQHLWVLQL